jgi:uncharacterized phiE125 gp8 family phage protein
MPLILTSPPATEPVALAEAKAHLRVTHADEDTYISTLITAARRQVEARTGLRLITQGWSLFKDAWPLQPDLSLELAQVSAINDILIYGESGSPATYDPAHYYLDAVSKPSRAVLRQDRLPPMPGRAVNGIEVRFTVGFGAAAAVPEDLKQAILLTIAHWFDHRGDADGASLPLQVNDIIRQHRIVRLT